MRTVRPIVALGALLTSGLFASLCWSGPPAQPGPHFCKARLSEDGKSVVLRCLSATGLQEEVVTYSVKTDLGEIQKKAIVGRQGFEETITTLPLAGLKAVDRDNQPLTAERLAEVLAAEAPVVVFSSDDFKPEALPVFGKDVVILISPVSPIGGND